MKWSLGAGAIVAGVFLLAGCNGGTSSSPPLASNPYQGLATQSSDLALGTSTFVLPANVRRACDETPREGYAECDALVRTDVGGPGAAVPGYGPSDLQSAYNLPSATKGANQTIAIVDAYDDPNAETDLATYRSNFGLPACTTKNGCFQKLNQLGKPGPYPQPNQGWALEISLDLDMVSAICPKCHIMLVESNDNFFNNLGSAVDRAARLGANTISNSYSAKGNYRAGGASIYYDHPGIIILVASGDTGYGPSIPGGYPSTISVGGTSLHKGGGTRGWTETVWGGTGSGCDTHQAKPVWQTHRDCRGRIQNDVAAVADPSTGVAVRDTYQAPGWIVVGGTSVATPLLAGVYGLAANERTLNVAQSLYTHKKDLYDITSGSNGTCTPPAGRAYLCTAEVGFDGPTGNGTPNGIGAF
ncbi:MAG: peptidase S8 [Candidatus Eremiobacteraeota bacterium]|nr:peptidase S8 [Candidatus Eremiobacteraeota bacterium]